jgi:hypothetical protein
LDFRDVVERDLWNIGATLKAKDGVKSAVRDPNVEETVNFLRLEIFSVLWEGEWYGWGMETVIRNGIMVPQA